MILDGNFDFVSSIRFIQMMEKKKKKLVFRYSDEDKEHKRTLKNRLDSLLLKVINQLAKLISMSSIYD